MLKNIKFAGRTMTTAYGKVAYDHNGITEDLTPEQEKLFAKIEGYEIINTKKEVKQEAKGKPKKEEPKKEEPKKEEPEFTKADLDKKTVPELDKLAEEKGIELKGTVKKEKIEEILQAL